MPVETTHPEYDFHLPSWLRARDVFAGEDAVKSAGVRYLPRLDSQTDDEYLAYNSRASFFNATARTAEGFVGLVFRREPTFKIPEKSSGVGRALSSFVEDANMLGTSLTAYAKDVVREVVCVGRAGSLVDWEDEVEKRAYAVLYQTEQIINWRMERVNKTIEIVLKHYFQPGREAFRHALQTAMPKLLTNGQKSPKDEMREILEKMTAKTWKRDQKRMLELLAGN